MSLIISTFAFVIVWWFFGEASLWGHFLYAFFFVLMAIAFFFGPRIILRKHKLVPLTESVPKKLLGQVCRMLGLKHLPKSYVVESSQTACCVVGNSERNATFVVSKPILNLLTKEELKAVFAHELSHIKNKDMVFVTWAKAYNGIVMYWFIFLMVFMFVSAILMGHPLVIILQGITARFLLLGSSLVLLPKLVLNSVSRLREMLADARASLYVGKQNIGSALKAMFLVEYVLNKLGKEKRSLNLDSILKKILPIRFYRYTLSEQPSLKERVHSLVSERYVKGEGSYCTPSLESSVWVGASTFLMLLSIIVPLGTLLSSLGLIELPIIGVLVAGAPFILLSFLNNIWIWRSEDRVFEIVWGWSPSTSHFVKDLFFHSLVSVGTYFALIFSWLIISPLFAGTSQAPLNALAILALTFAFYVVVSMLVSSILIVIKTQRAKKATNLEYSGQ